MDFWSIFGPYLDEVRPICSAEPSVKLAEPVRFGRTTFLADRSFTTITTYIIKVPFLKKLPKTHTSLLYCLAWKMTLFIQKSSDVKMNQVFINKNVVLLGKT